MFHAGIAKCWGNNEVEILYSVLTYGTSKNVSYKPSLWIQASYLFFLTRGIVFRVWLPALRLLAGLVLVIARISGRTLAPRSGKNNNNRLPENQPCQLRKSVKKKKRKADQVIFSGCFEHVEIVNSIRISIHPSLVVPVCKCYINIILPEFSSMNSQPWLYHSGNPHIWRMPKLEQSATEKFQELAM